jgi:hypothetical protein
MGASSLYFRQQLEEIAGLFPLTSKGRVYINFDIYLD